MDTFLCIMKAIIGYIILMFVGTNLLGMIVCGFRPTNKRDSEGNLTSLEDITSNGSIIMTIIFALISVLCFYFLYHYWNVGILTAGLILMFTRLPDLLFETKTGEKINSKNMPKKPVDVLCTILSWVALPLIWYSLCYMK